MAPGAFRLPFQLNEANPVLRGSILTDRGVYQPGEIVQFKAFVRLDTPTGRVLLEEGKELEATIHDARGGMVERSTSPVVAAPRVAAKAPSRSHVPATGAAGKSPTFDRMSSPSTAM